MLFLKIYNISSTKYKYIYLKKTPSPRNTNKTLNHLATTWNRMLGMTH